MKKAVLVLLFSFSLVGCFGRPQLMTRETFDSISLGEPLNEVTAKAGQPYAVREKGHSVEYEYVERVEVDQDYAIENHYFLTISEGQVVSKKSTVTRTPAYNLIYEDNPNYLEY